MYKWVHSYKQNESTMQQVTLQRDQIVQISWTKLVNKMDTIIPHGANYSALTINVSTSPTNYS